MKDHPLYPRQDAQALGRFYLAHVAGMTEADLHEKSDICEQLAWRDKKIAELELALGKLRVAVINCVDEAVDNGTRSDEWSRTFVEMQQAKNDTYKVFPEHRT